MVRADERKFEPLLHQLASSKERRHFLLAELAKIERQSSQLLDRAVRAQVASVAQAYERRIRALEDCHWRGKLFDCQVRKAGIVNA
jgi:hypothetical protein